MQLNNLEVGSGPAQLALTKQFKSDKTYYLKVYSMFINAATNDQDIIKLAMEYAIGDFAGDPDAYSTLVHIAPLDDELGALVQNATIFAIAVTTTYYIKGTIISSGIAEGSKTPTGEKPYAPAKSWDDYVQYMKTEHPNTVAVVAQIRLGLTARSKYKRNILAVMGYLIDQATRK